MSSIRVHLVSHLGLAAFAPSGPGTDPGPVVPHLVTNPADDQEFRRFAMEAVAADADPVAFVQRLHERYPAAAVHQRMLSGEPWLVWYVYREGHWVGRTGEDGGDR